MSEKKAVVVAEFLKEFLKLNGEISYLHGRYEVSKEGIRIMRDLTKHAMEALRKPEAKEGPVRTDPVLSPKYAAKELPANVKSEEMEMWRGYQMRDVRGAIATVHKGVRMSIGESGLLRCNEQPGVSRSGWNYKFDHTHEQELDIRRLGARRPEEPDYKPFA